MFDLLFGKNKKEKAMEKDRLIRFREELKEIEKMPREKEMAFKYVYFFFNFISVYQDIGFKFAKNAKEINSLLDEAGRQPYGWNRTKRGEEVTYDNFYCGGRFGLNTLPLRKWMKSDTVYKDFFKRWYPNLAAKNVPDPMDWQVVVFFIIEPFINEKKRLLIKSINEGIATL